VNSLAAGQLGDDTFLSHGLRLGLQEAVAGHAPDRLTRLILLTDGFAADEQAAAQVAAQVAQHGFGLSTVGLGTAFNEGFLIGLAESSGGNAHLVFQPSDIPAIFAAEFEASQQVLLRSLSFRLALTQGVEVRRAYRVQPLIGELGLEKPYDRSLSLNLGDLERNQPQALLLELLVPPRPPGAYRLAQIVVTGEVPLAAGDRALVRGDVLLHIIAAPQSSAVPDGRVMKLVEAVNTFKLQTQALADATAGNTAGATRKLQAVATRLLAGGDLAMAALVQVELEHLAQTGAVTPEGAKTLRYETRKLTQKLDE
jgi:Ca-activated chloride channel family protein